MSKLAVLPFIFIVMILIVYFSDNYYLIGISQKLLYPIGEYDYNTSEATILNYNSPSRMNTSEFKALLQITVKEFVRRLGHMVGSEKTDSSCRNQRHSNFC